MPKGIIPWNKGLKNIYSINTKNLMRLAHLNKKHTPEWKQKMSVKMTGREIYWKDKISKSHLGICPSKEAKEKMKKAKEGTTQSEKTRKKRSESLRGDKCYLWKGGVTLKNKIIRSNIEIRLWREKVFKRDNYTCQKTKVKGKRLEAHHIQNFADFPELRFDVDNGITLSEKAHDKFHRIYGKKNNTKEQLIEFLLI